MPFERSNLSAFPRPQTSLIGRVSETATIHRRLARPNVRMLTLVGPGGIGKTRLALHAALTAPGFDEGRWFVDLAVVADPAQIGSQIARALGLPQRGDLPAIDQVIDRLDGRDILLVLDNFEHLLDGAIVVSQILARASGFKVVVTSRAPLNLAYEHLVAVGPLSTTPSTDADHGDAFELFLQRSRAVRTGFEPTPADREAIAAICDELAGLPLAIELAAARTRVMAPPAILSRMSQPLRLLASGPSDAPARHRSMRDAIDWSYRLLPEDQRAVLRAMSVFSGSVPLDGLEAVVQRAGIADPETAIELAALLVDASMIEAVERDAGEPRFLIAAAVREFLLDELEVHGELAAAREHHALWIEALAAQAAREFEGPREHIAFARLRTELDNVRAALEGMMERLDFARAARLASTLGVFWSFGGYANEGLRWLDRLEMTLPDLGLAPRDEFQFWVASGLASWARGDAPLAEIRYARALEIAQRMGDPQSEAYAWMWLAQSAWYNRDYQVMRERSQKGVAIGPRGSIPWAGAQTLLGIAEMRLDRFAEAQRDLEIAHQRHAEIGFTRAAIWTLQLLGDLAFLQGDLTHAARAHRESLALGLESDSAWATFEAFSGLIAVTTALGWTTEALELLASAELLLATTSIRPREGAWLSDADRAALKAAVDPRDMQRLAQNAAALPMPELVARAATIARAVERGPTAKAPRAPRKKAAASAFDLSPREQQVLALLVQGKTDREIGELLLVSYSTARAHVAHVLHKLDARNRAVAVRKALEHDLV